MRLHTVIGVVFACGFCAQAQAQLSVTLDSSVPSPAPVGTVVTWQATVSGVDSGTVWYRFRSRRSGSIYRTIRDYSPQTTLDWTAADYDGFYDVEVSAINKNTGEIASASRLFQMTSRLVDGNPLISPTNHPLVFLYSAPPCAGESRLRVTFTDSSGLTQNTPYKSCRAGQSVNFYLAGMRPAETYVVQHVEDTGSAFVEGPSLSFTMPAMQQDFAGYKTLQPLAGPAEQGLLLQSTLSQPSVATDLQGHVLWFYTGNISTLTRPEAGGTFYGIGSFALLDASQQFVREFDLAGLTVAETNAARVSEQLVTRGKRQITAFHHEARSLPGGRMLVLASTEQIFTGVQGDGPVNVLGDMILVLDSDLHVEWAWDAFDHLDPSRMATLRETCGHVGGGCPPFYLADRANDWLHGNSVQFTPDGNLLYSARHQDWVIKINYDGGAGSGEVLWRLGKDGDFLLDSSDAAPWFSHQHDPNIESADPTRLALFDNGNVRAADDSSAHSRGQVIQINEQSHTASLLLNADLGTYSYALGSARRLSTGDYHFLLGWLPGQTASRNVQVDSSGAIVFALEATATEYRSFRMRDLYSPN